jgi:hypothetical protein
MNSPPPPFSFILSSPFVEQFQQISFFHLYACVHSIFIIFTFPYPFLTSSLLPLIPHPPTPGRTCSALLFSDFVKGKKKMALLFV